MQVIRSAHIPPSRSANKKGAAEFFGVSVNTIDAWLLRGCPTIQRGTQGVPWVLDLLEIAQWRYGASDVPGVEFDPEQLTPKERLDWYSSEAKRLEVERKQAELIPADVYRRELAAVCKSITQLMDTLPDILERDCGLTGDMIERVQIALDKQRDELANSLESIAA